MLRIEGVVFWIFQRVSGWCKEILKKDEGSLGADFLKEK